MPFNGIIWYLATLAAIVFTTPCTCTFMRQAYKQDGDEFVSALRSEVLNSSKATLGEIESLFPQITLQETTVAAPCPHRPLTRDEDETRRDEDQYKKKTKTNCDLAKTSTPESSQTATSELQTFEGPTEATKQSRLATGG